MRQRGKDHFGSAAEPCGAVQFLRDLSVPEYQGGPVGSENRIQGKVWIELSHPDSGKRRAHGKALRRVSGGQQFSNSKQNHRKLKLKPKQVEQEYFL